MTWLSKRTTRFQKTLLTFVFILIVTYAANSQSITLILADNTSKNHSI